MDAEELIKAFEKRDQALIEKLAAVELKSNGNEACILELGQKMARGGGGSGWFGGGGRGGSLGAQFVESDGFKSFAETPNRRGKVDLQTKATITSLTTDAAGSAGALNSPHRDAIVLLPQRRMRVRDLLPQIRITSSSVDVMRQKVRNLAAGMVAEGTLKPESDIQMELVNVAVRTIAHWMKASRQILDDAPQLQGIIDSELLYGLMLKEESQLLSGDNTGQNLYGMIPQATAFAAPFTVTAPTLIDVIGLGLLQNALAEYPADGVIMNSADWMRIRLIKDSDGNYIYGPPSEAVEPRIFGVPVVPTQAMTADKFLVGQFQVAATIYDRWDARVEVATENEDDFVRNLLTILAEERLAFAVKKPLALTYGDFSDAVTAATAV